MWYEFTKTTQKKALTHLILQGQCVNLVMNAGMQQITAVFKGVDLRLPNKQKTNENIYSYIYLMLIFMCLKSLMLVMTITKN